MDIDEIIDKIKHLSEVTPVTINKISLDECTDWRYDDSYGEIRNKSGSFFRIAGLIEINGEKIANQPILLQDEIGYLGIIRKRINGEMMYLMQYKIEPGNVNQIQISPTIQATKSNFMRTHGGRAPSYLDYFINSSKYKIIFDQIQSEQSSRFLGKRNRNVIIELSKNEDIEVLSSHDWMSLEQIKALMRIDNLVNMDARTVLSCLPCSEYYEYESLFHDKALYDSMMYGDGVNHLPQIYNYINDRKMFDESRKRVVSLFSLPNWSMKDNEFVCDSPYSFRVIFCDISIEGREVTHWQQPLFEATGIATFGLFTCVVNGIRLFLVRCCSEIGCFDKLELGPTVQREFISSKAKDTLDNLFDEKLERNEGVIFDTLLSEEGGRFYHEQNRNVIIEIKKEEAELSAGCFWCDYKMLNELVRVNNTLNIQLRNLLSVLEL